MNERGSELYHIIGELTAIGNMLQLLQSGKNQLLMQQAIHSATVAVDICRPLFGYRKCAFSMMLEWLEVETGISGKGVGVG